MFFMLTPLMLTQQPAGLELSNSGPQGSPSTALTTEPHQAHESPLMIHPYNLYFILLNLDSELLTPAE